MHAAPSAGSGLTPGFNRTVGIAVQGAFRDQACSPISSPLLLSCEILLAQTGRKAGAKQSASATEQAAISARWKARCNFSIRIVRRGGILGQAVRAPSRSAFPLSALFFHPISDCGRAMNSRSTRSSVTNNGCTSALPVISADRHEEKPRWSLPAPVFLTWQAVENLCRRARRQPCRKPPIRPQLAHSRAHRTQGHS